MTCVCVCGGGGGGEGGGGEGDEQYRKFDRHSMSRLDDDHKAHDI